MGPQLVRCGMLLTPANGDVANLGFNGAATCSLRNEVDHIRTDGSIDRASMGPQLVRCGMHGGSAGRDLGGIASMGPQLVRCGMMWTANEPVRNPELQWGRNLFVAECADCHLSFVPYTRLQWGRNLFVAEWGDADKSHFVIYQLQWGRNLFVAEWLPPGIVVAGLRELQWGRNLFVAE